MNTLFNYFRPLYLLTLFGLTAFLLACQSAALEPNRAQGPAPPDQTALVEPSHPPPQTTVQPSSQPSTPLSSPPSSTLSSLTCHFQPAQQRTLLLSAAELLATSNFRVVPLAEPLFGFGLAGWLPDNQRLLFTTSNTAVGQIGLIDLAHNQIQPIAQRIDLLSQPVWLPSQQAVLFVDVGQTGWKLQLSQEMQTEPVTLQADLGSAHIALAPNHTAVTAVSANQTPLIIGPNEAAVPLVHPDTLPIQPASPLSADDSPQLAWSTDGRWLAQYNRHYFLLFDTAVGSACLLDLGRSAEGSPRWAVHAQWSGNGRYLGVITAVADPEQLVYSTELTIVDWQTGTIDIWQPDAPYPLWHDIAWAPDDQRLVAKIAIEQHDGIWLDGLFFVDLERGSLQRLLPETDFYAGLTGQGLAWSPDGSTLAMTCSNGPLCLLGVSR